MNYNRVVNVIRVVVLINSIQLDTKYFNVKEKEAYFGRKNIFNSGCDLFLRGYNNDKTTLPSKKDLPLPKGNLFSSTEMQIKN